jgi:hypothetical protein
MNKFLSINANNIDRGENDKENDTTNDEDELISGFEQLNFHAPHPGNVRQTKHIHIRII